MYVSRLQWALTKNGSELHGKLFHPKNLLSYNSTHLTSYFVHFFPLCCIFTQVYTGKRKKWIERKRERKNSKKVGERERRGEVSFKIMNNFG